MALRLNKPDGLIAAWRLRRLWTPEWGWVMLCLAVVTVTGLLAAGMLGWGFVSGTGSYWQYPPYDAGAHLSGWLFYKQDAWRFPLFETVRMAHPDGMSIILTDSIPLVALVAKALGGGLWANWHYFGIFVWGSYVLNAVALLWVLRQLGIRSLVGALFAVVFALCTTLYNIQFESFYAHFFVLFSLGLYIRLRQQYSLQLMLVFAALVTASLLVHPYLFAMSAALLLVTIVQLWWDLTISLKAACLWVAGFAVGIGAIFGVSGYGLHQPSGYQEHLYGTSNVFALDAAAVLDKTYTVDEIGTYLGVGFWLLLAVGLWAGRTQIKTQMRRHRFLAVLLLLMLLFALSNTLFVAGKPIVHVDLPQPVLTLLEMFRASKRFVLPLYYVAAIVAVAILLKRRTVWTTGLVLAALTLQIIDTAYFTQGQYVAARQAQITTIDHAQLRQELSAVQYMYAFPSYSCLFNYRETPMSGQWPASLELYQTAAREQVISNSIRASRRTQDCTAEAVKSQTAPAQGSLYVYFRDDNGKFILPPPSACVAHHRQFSYGIYCTIE